MRWYIEGVLALVLMWFVGERASGMVEQQQPLLNGGSHSSSGAAAVHQAGMGMKGPTFRCPQLPPPVPSSVLCRPCCVDDVEDSLACLQSQGCVDDARRSKDEIMAEIRQLQNEMASYDEAAHISQHAGAKEN